MPEVLPAVGKFALGLAMTNTEKASLREAIEAWASQVHRFDNTGNYFYLGKAPQGSSQSAQHTIFRLTISSGAVVATGIAIGAWTNRTSLTYGSY